MSRNKPPLRDGRAKETPRGNPSRAPRRIRTKWILLALAVIGVGSIAAYYLEGWRRSRSELAAARDLLTQNATRAEELAEQAIMSAGGDYPEAQLVRCRALAASGQWDTALGCYSLISRFTTCQTGDLVALGEAASQAGEWKLAVQSLQEAARRDDNAATQAKELLIQLDLQFHRTDDALQQCRVWQRASPNTAEPWAIAGDIETSLVNLGAAIDDYRQALRRSPPSKLEQRVRGALAQLLVHTGETAAARDEFDKLIAFGPLTGRMQLSYAQLLRVEGRTADALAEVNRNIDQSGPNAESLKWRGILELDEGHVAEALQALRQSVKGNPFDISTQHKLGQAYQLSGDAESARQHLERSQKMTEATYRMSEVEDLLRADPTNSELKRELQGLRATLGR